MTTMYSPIAEFNLLLDYKTKLASVSRHCKTVPLKQQTSKFCTLIQRTADVNYHNIYLSAACQCTI